eukprot:4985365-Pleurochrysis_carterae.AAC.1
MSARWARDVCAPCARARRAPTGRVRVPPREPYPAPALRLSRVFPARTPTPPPAPAPCSLTGRSLAAPIRRTWPRGPSPSRHQRLLTPPAVCPRWPAGTRWPRPTPSGLAV